MALKIFWERSNAQILLLNLGFGAASKRDREDGEHFLFVNFPEIFSCSSILIAFFYLGFDQNIKKIQYISRAKERSLAQKANIKFGRHWHFPQLFNSIFLISR